MGKAPLQQLVDKVSTVFVPVVMAIALFTLLVWYAIVTTSVRRCWRRWPCW